MTREEVLKKIEQAKTESWTELSLRKSSLTEVPAEIGQLTGLTRLLLDNNSLREMPSEIGQLTNLTTLSLRNNDLVTLPSEIGQLINLARLDLHNNGLNELPVEIGQLTHLARLELRENKLTQLPISIGQLTNLTELYLSQNSLIELPVEIGQLTNLNKLLLSDNNLRTLPVEIGQLTNIEELHMFGNEFKTFPIEICQLKTLTRLSLRKNNLTELPEEIGQLSNLRYLNLQKNKLNLLPKGLKQLKFLTELYLHDNDSLNLNNEVLGGKWDDKDDLNAPPKDLLEFYFRNKEGSQPLNEAKLILVGFGAVGKTSLVKRLIYNDFSETEDKTPGIQISDWKLTLHGNENINLNVWDFGGQEIMHSTHQFFLTQRSLYLLVLNGRQGHEDADAEYWLSLIESFSDDSPVIIVFNKFEEQPFDLNRRVLRQKYPFIKGFVETDCKANLGLDELKKAIETETDKLEHLRMPFPTSWFGIKDKLVAMKNNYLSFEEYRTICDDLGEEDTSAQESLAIHLHNLGVALNFRDDRRLRDTHVLNPHWVTNGIYQILNSLDINKQKGEFYSDDLTKILDKTDYPPIHHNYLLDLMNKFELCFQFPESETYHYLIPELLDKQQPDEASNFSKDTCLTFEYHYPILPEGLLPRFTVITHSMSNDLPRWKTGVILEFEKNQALVISYVQDKKISIFVKGSLEGRRRLLAVIRHDFERIHRGFKFQPEEMVSIIGHPNHFIPYKQLIVMEDKGIKDFPHVVGNEVVTIDIQEHLNGIDLKSTQENAKPNYEQVDSLKVFCSYSHKDESLQDELETHLKLLQMQGYIETWHDRKILPGNEWEGEIDQNLERADIILLLISIDFILSEYCFDIEMKRALERHEDGEAIVIPIILRKVDNLFELPFGKLQALPKDGTAVKSWSDRDEAWSDVIAGIRRVIQNDT